MLKVSKNYKNTNVHLHATELSFEAFHIQRLRLFGFLGCRLVLSLMGIVLPTIGLLLIAPALTLVVALIVALSGTTLLPTLSLSLFWEPDFQLLLK